MRFQTFQRTENFICKICKTGSAPAAAKIGALLGLDEVHSQLLPQDKVAKMEQITKTHRTAFVGDGMNGAPVLAMADVGFAMGGMT